MDWSAVDKQIAQATGMPFAAAAFERLGGGCINSAVAVTDGERRYFVKLNEASRIDMFEAEAAGLAELINSCSVRIPSPICWGTADESAYLVLEYIALRGGNRGPILGQQLAKMHRVHWDQFGWWRDNTIGATPQRNTPTVDWVEFWKNQRLGVQMDLAAANGYGGRLLERGERLLADLDVLFKDYLPQASLLHGDLWSGNCGEDSLGRPVIFDPAPYFGDREADLAMTELFGGFSAAFYDAYRETWPLDPGYGVRKHLYNLYHILNHLNLFGDGYRPQAEAMIDRVLAACA